MEIIIEGNLKKLIPTEKQYLLAKTDIDKEEKERNYFTFAPRQIYRFRPQGENIDILPLKHC